MTLLAVGLFLIAGCGPSEIAEEPSEQVEQAASAARSIQEVQGTFELDVLGDLEAQLQGPAICSLVDEGDELRLALHPEQAEYPYFFKLATDDFVGPASYEGELQIDGPRRSWGEPSLIVRYHEDDERPGPGLVITVASEYSGEAGNGTLEGIVQCDPFEESS